MNTDELAPIDHEPTPQEALTKGVDLICFSGDKLLGGPQSGIIAGRSELIEGIKSEPFFRAVRCDKLILTVLQESIDAYLRTQASPMDTDVPNLVALALSSDQLRARAEIMLEAIGSTSKADISIAESIATTGGGTMPRSKIPSISLQIKPTGISLNKLSKLLRTGLQAIVAYTQDDKLLLDLRTVFDWQDELVSQRLKEVLNG